MGLNEAQRKERSEYLEKHLTITECSQRKPYVFVSYASDNWKTVFQSVMVPLQKQYGLRIYADKAFDKVNDKWIVPMLRNIRGADAMIAFVSQSYIESYACFLELLTAVNTKKQIVFVSLGEQLRLGDTTDQPEVERGVKKEILNQGGNIATNTNNTSSDLMRAMKSAYTSLATLLEQDSLSKYDISDAFINFFRDAAINRKSANDLIAVEGTIRSLSADVFDLALITAPPQPSGRPAPLPDSRTMLWSDPQPAPQAQPKPAPQPAPQAQPKPAPQPAPQAQPKPAPQPAPQAQPMPTPQPAPQAQPKPTPQPADPDSSGRKQPLAGLLIGIAALIFIFSLVPVGVVLGAVGLAVSAKNRSKTSTSVFIISLLLNVIPLLLLVIALSYVSA